VRAVASVALASAPITPPRVAADMIDPKLAADITDPQLAADSSDPALDVGAARQGKGGPPVRVGRRPGAQDPAATALRAG
jgi:hypothetical protein